MFVVVDIETTGLSRHRHGVTEIAAAKVDNGQIIERYHTLVNPEQRIPPFITELTGITNSMVADAPRICNILPAFLQFLGQDVFVAHNATFDFNFLNHNCMHHHNVSITNPKLCTRKLASRLLPNVPSKRLAALCQYYQIQNRQAHRAMGDVEATVGVLNNLLIKLRHHNITEVADILSFEQMPPTKLRSLNIV